MRSIHTCMFLVHKVAAKIGLLGAVKGAVYET